MKKEFIECKSRETAKRKARWAAMIIRVTGGYMAFESVTDYRIWKNQK